MTKKFKSSLKIEVNEDDIAVFREAMRGIKPLIYNKIIKKTLPSFKKPFSSLEQIDQERVLDLFSDYETLPAVGSEESLYFARPGVQNKALRDLRQGKNPIQASLDLHGMVVAQARQALSEFLFICGKRGLRYILVIHGKGYNNKPVLKNKLNHWLRQTDHVLAFSSAVGKDGRTGAIYILLKKIIKKGESV